MTLRVLSLFSGAGGADLALEAAGMTVAALCEIEPHARAVLRHHWPDVPLHGDVSELDGTQYRGKVDIVVGGSPCQDLSVAGKRAGLAEGSGTRSSLFYEQVRIWNETESPYLIWENVKGAFSSAQGADFGAVLSALVGRPVPVPRDGWTNGGVVAGPAAVAAWRLLDLQYFGVPQRRERIVVLASRAGGVDPAEVLALGQSVSRDHPPRFQAREGTAPAAVAGVDGTGARVTYAFKAGQSEAAGGTFVTPYAPTLQGQNNGSTAVPCVFDGRPDAAVVSGCDGEMNPATGEVMGTLKARERGGGNQLPAVAAVNISNAVATLDNVMGTLDADGASTTAIGAQTRGVVLTYDARGNGEGVIVNTLAGDHQNRVTDYTALVLNTQQAITQYGDMAGTLSSRGDGSPCADRGPNMVVQQATAFHLTQDPINGPVSPALGVTSHGMGVVAPTLTAANDPSRSPQSSEVTAQVSAILHAESAPTLAFKIRGGVEVDSAGKTAGKGYLGSEEMAFTLGVSQDQHIHQPAFRMVAFGEYAEDGTASAIKARDFKDATDLTLVSPGVPRRLMPSECEALMGWPRNHTKYGVNEKGVRYELADTPRYKLCGNGIGKEWMEWVGMRLMDAEEKT
jgi:site-specific DNA-cytosine methylase